MEKAMRFAKKVVIVTGGASGIGLATAQRFHAEGAIVVIADRDADKATDAAASLKRDGGPDAWASACDVSDAGQVTASVDGAMQRFGRIDVVINNAGLMTFDPLGKLDTEDWRRVMGVDLLGAFHFTRLAFLHMSHGGAIVNVASIHALQTSPFDAPYAAAKAALLSLTRSAAIEGQARGIRVNAVLPGAIDTPMLWNNPNVKSGAEKLDPTEVGKPEHVAAAIAFLASEDAAFVQGTTLIVDGGRMARL
jgi:NAD(P)-dependent dehydrogenase (short-subunit alcohol dehydrogenase family)